MTGTRSSGQNPKAFLIKRGCWHLPVNIWVSSSTPSACSQQKWKHMSTQMLVLGNSVHNRQKVGSVQMSTSWRVDKQNLYLYNGMGFPGGSDGKESACKAGDLGSIPGWGRSPGEGNSYPLQFTCLENSMDRGAGWTAVHSTAKSWTKWLTLSHTLWHTMKWAFQVVLVEKNSLPNAGGQETQVRSLGWEDPLQYCLWRSPWTEEPGRLWSMGL